LPAIRGARSAPRRPHAPRAGDHSDQREVASTRTAALIDAAMTCKGLTLVDQGGLKQLAASLVSICAIITPLPATAEILDYDCVVDELKISLHIDTDVQMVRQIAVVSGSVTVIGEYSDGVYGPIFHEGPAVELIPSVHQFVHVTEESIDYGAELRGTIERAVLNRRLATLTLPSGKTGWCSRGQ
jgi:hypothetical protein